MKGNTSNPGGFRSALMTQVIKEPTREDALLVLVLINKEGLAGDVSDSGLPIQERQRLIGISPVKYHRKDQEIGASDT